MVRFHSSFTMKAYVAETPPNIAVFYEVFQSICVSRLISAALFGHGNYEYNRLQSLAWYH